jgi:hypothetical protein
VSVGNWFALGGITWQVNRQPGAGEIRFWKEATKETQYPAMPAGPSSTFYIEGTGMSSALNDVEIKFFYNIQMPGQPMQHVETTKTVTVTPMLESFTVTPKSPPKVTVMLHGGGALQGLTSGQQSAPGEPFDSGAVGATFASAVNKSGVSGDKFYVQNMMNVTNGSPGGSPAGLVFMAFSNKPPMNLVPKQGLEWPLLDKINLEVPPPPDYNGTTDTPFITPQFFGVINTVDILFELRLHLMFRYADQSIISLAYINWSVYFKAARNAQNQVIVADDGVTSAGTFVRNHHALPPKLNGTTFNHGFEFRPA